MCDHYKVKGLSNLGNTCYMNSALQGILASDIFSNMMLIYINDNHECIESLSPALLEYCKLIVSTVKSDNTTIVPRIFKHVVGKIDSRFAGFRQEDAHEFLVFLFNEFVEDRYDKGLSDQIREVCFGKYKQYIKCTECKNITESYNSFLDIQLPIPQKKNINLEDCFNLFSGTEALDNEDKYNCSKCNKKVRALKRMELDHVPDLAIFAFKRFRGLRKNNDVIEVYPFIKLDGKSLKLIATINHSGGVAGGHYTSRVCRNNRWCAISDSHVREITIDHVLKDPGIYITIYQNANN